MPSVFLEYRVRVRNAANTADVLTVTSVRGDALPYLIDAPHADGSEFDPLTGAYRSGSCTVRIADAITSGTSRVVTAQLEDTSFRQQLAGRAAYVEERADGGAWTSVQAGILTALRLASPAVWELVIGDTTRATRNLSAFAPKRNASNATIVEPLATYLTRWPQRGCLAGGPIIGDFLGVKDRGGWEMVVDATITTTDGRKLKHLALKGGYAPPGFGYSTTAAGPLADSLNTAIGPRTGPPLPTAFPADLEPSSWPNVVVQVGTVNCSPASLYDAAVALGTGSTFLSLLKGAGTFMATESSSPGFYVWDTADALTVAGTVLRVRVFDAIPTERSPIYLTSHPVALWTKLCDEVGLTYQSSDVTAVTSAVGSDRRVSLRIPGTQAWASFTESTLYGPCGFSVRTNADGTLSPFSSRILVSAAPTRTITSADVPQDHTVLFDLSEPDAITRVTVAQQNLVATTADSGDAGSGPTDGVVMQSVSVERTSGDAGGTVEREQSYSLPGFLHMAGTQSYAPGIVDAMALEIFDRQSRGRLSGETLLLRGGAGDGAVLGDEIIVPLPSMPNHNKRIGDDGTVAGRVVQIVRMTKEPRGSAIRYLDSGANAQTVATLPTLSIAAGYGVGGVTVTVTNAATLNAAGIGLRLQWAATSGAAPVTGQYTDVAAYLAGAIPTTAITLPPVAGQTVYVHARSEQPGVRPSSYTTAVSVATSGYSAPTSLTATPSGTDGRKCLLLWTIGTGASAAGADVFLRPQAAAASADVRVATLLPGSVGYPLTDLTPSALYTASVQHRGPSGELSAKTTVNFTAGATAYTLATPSIPTGIVGTTDANGLTRVDGTYGLNVSAVEIPGTVEFLEAIETGIASGTYGTPASVATLPSVSGAVTEWRSIAPHDRLRRSLTARHIAPGATTSASTTAVVVDPWGAVRGPTIPGTASFGATGLSLNSYATNTMLSTWSWLGDSTATFDIYTQDGGGGFGLAVSAAAGATSATFAVAENLDGSGTLHVTIKAYVVAVVGSTVAATSATSSSSQPYLP